MEGAQSQGVFHGYDMRKERNHTKRCLIINKGKSDAPCWQAGLRFLTVATDKETEVPGIRDLPRGVG